MSDTLLVTGSSGFIGSEVVEYFTRIGWRVDRVDNNQRADFSGPAGDSRWNQKRLLERYPTFTHHELDIRDRNRVARPVADFSSL